MAEYIRAVGKNDKYFEAIRNSIILVKCCHTKLWENSLQICQQLKKVGQVSARALIDAGKINFNELLNTTPREFECVRKVFFSQFIFR